MSEMVGSFKDHDTQICSLILMDLFMESSTVENVNSFKQYINLIHWIQ